MAQILTGGMVNQRRDYVAVHVRLGKEGIADKSAYKLPDLDLQVGWLARR